MFDVPFDQMVQTELVPGLKRIERNGKAASADKKGSNRGRLAFSRLGELTGLKLSAQTVSDGEQFRSRAHC
jgi:hypothetical protein